MLYQDERHAAVGWQRVEKTSACLEAARGGAYADDEKSGAGIGRPPVRLRTGRVISRWAICRRHSLFVLNQKTYKSENQL
jgi:hypothetical protein